MRFFNSISHFIKKPSFWFFLILFCTGSLIFDDYGLGWDDEWSRIDTGFNNFNYVFHGDKTLLSNNEKYHGPFVEMLLATTEKLITFKDISGVYQMRHGMLFIIFLISLIAFYNAAKLIFGEKYGLLACLIILLSPRIFAESFYNSKDIAFLSFFNFVLYTYFSFLKQQNIKWALIHALFSAFLIDIRILGIMVPLLTVFYFLIFLRTSKVKKQAYSSIFIYIIATLFFTVLFWPVLWESPIHHFGQAFAEMRKYHWDADVFFWGNTIHASHLPWYYLPIWIFITTPMIYTIFMILGLLFYIRNILKQALSKTIAEYEMPSIMAFFLAPILSVIVLNSVIYDGWRHLYFIFPMFVLISVYGLKNLTELISNYPRIKNGIFLILLINMGLTSFWMIKNHPNQNVYFNQFSRTFMDAGGKFELDYWGISYRQGLEYLLENEKDSLLIKYTSLNLPGKINQLILNLDNRMKLQYCENSDSTWVYYLTNYRGMGPPDNVELLHQIKVDNINIMGVYKAKKSK